MDDAKNADLEFLKGRVAQLEITVTLLVALRGSENVDSLRELLSSFSARFDPVTERSPFQEGMAFTTDTLDKLLAVLADSLKKSGV